MADTAACGSCRFFLKDETGSYCRRYPPSVFPFPNPAGIAQQSFFPSMAAEGWCGEYQRKGPALNVVRKPEPGDGSQRLP